MVVVVVVLVGGVEATGVPLPGFVVVGGTEVVEVVAVVVGATVVVVVLEGCEVVGSWDVVGVCDAVEVVPGGLAAFVGSVEVVVDVPALAVTITG